MRGRARNFPTITLSTTTTGGSRSVVSHSSHGGCGRSLRLAPLFKTPVSSVCRRKSGVITGLLAPSASSGRRSLPAIGGMFTSGGRGATKASTAKTT